MNKVQFTMEFPTSTLEVLDLKLKFDKESKQISVDLFAKDTDSFTYDLPSTCFPKNNIENIPKGVPLRLRRICDSDFEIIMNLKIIMQNIKNIQLLGITSQIK